MIRVGEICENSEVSIEIFRRIKVDGTEACIWYVKQGISWSNNQENDQSCNSEEDEEKTKEHAEDCKTPYNRIRLPWPSLLQYGLPVLTGIYMT